MPRLPYISRRDALKATGALIGIAALPTIAAAHLRSNTERTVDGYAEIQLSTSGQFTEGATVFIEGYAVPIIVWSHSNLGGTGADTAFVAPTSNGHLMLSVETNKSQVSYRLAIGHQHRLNVGGGHLDIYTSTQEQTRELA